VVATRHFPGGRGAGWPARVLAAVSARAVARDIAISRYVAAGVDAPSELLYNGVADQGQAPLTSPTVLMLQRLTPEKSPEVGLRAWAASGLARDGWRLVIAGSGSLAPSLTALADDLGVTRSVEFPGQLADTDAVIADSSILLATAPDEPFGLSVVEAMSHGLAVVAADGGAHVETVGDEGALFAPGDVDAAARALRSLAEDAATRSRMGDRLRRRQQRLFSLARHLDRLEEIYGQVVADARGRGSGR
jgi:glycosyltransferase involved in cell wall biosynthesis